MFKTDRNFLIGILGMLGSMIGFFVSLVLTQSQNHFTPYPPIFLLLIAFFMGFMLGGFFKGIVFAIGFIAIIGVAALIGGVVGYLTRSGILPENKLGLVILIFVLLLIIGPKLYQQIRLKKSNTGKPTDTAVCDIKQKRKISRKGKPKTDKGNHHPEAIFLIHPRWISTDIVYKVILLGENLYFCRVGGQFYEIRENECEYSAHVNEEVLLRDKYNFKIAVSDIVSADITSKNSTWTGHLPNNGLITLLSGTRKRKFIIHAVQNAASVYEFFHGISITSINFVDKEKSAQESSTKKTGSMVYKRNAGYITAKKITNVLNTLGLVCGMWMMFYPEPYLVAFIISAALPIIGAVIYIMFKEHVKFDEEKGKEHPNVGMAIIMPSMMLSFRAMLDFNVIHTKLLWVCLISATIFILIIILQNTREYKTKKWLPLLLVIFIFIYVYGVVIVSNCLFDHAEPKKYTSLVESKHKSSGKTTSYYLTVKPWGPYRSTQDVEVSKKMYETTQKGEELDFFLFNGAWGVQWYVPSKPD